MIATSLFTIYMAVWLCHDLGLVTAPMPDLFLDRLVDTDVEDSVDYNMHKPAWASRPANVHRIHASVRMSRVRRNLSWNQTPRTGGTGPTSSASRASCASLRHAYGRDRTRCHPLRRDGPRSSYRRLMARAYRYPAPHVCMVALPRLAEARMVRKTRPVKIFSHLNWRATLCRLPVCKLGTLVGES